jgi:hypothetical protein
MGIASPVASASPYWGTGAGDAVADRLLARSRSYGRPIRTTRLDRPGRRKAASMCSGRLVLASTKIGLRATMPCGGTIGAHAPLSPVRRIAYVANAWRCGRGDESRQRGKRPPVAISPPQPWPHAHDDGGFTCANIVAFPHRYIYCRQFLLSGVEQ